MHNFDVAFETRTSMSNDDDEMPNEEEDSSETEVMLNEATL